MAFRIGGLSLSSYLRYLTKLFVWRGRGPRASIRKGVASREGTRGSTPLLPLLPPPPPAVSCELSSVRDTETRQRHCGFSHSVPSCPPLSHWIEVSKCPPRAVSGLTRERECYPTRGVWIESRQTMRRVIAIQETVWTKSCRQPQGAKDGGQAPAEQRTSLTVNVRSFILLRFFSSPSWKNSLCDFIYEEI